MSDQSRSSHFRGLFEAALVDYKQQTGIELAEHPLAEHLQDCNSVESVTTILREQAQDFKKFREKDKVLKPLKKVLTVLHKLSSAANFAQDVGLHLPPVKAIQTGLGILLSPIKGTTDDYSALTDLLESIGHFLNRLEIYTEIPPTLAEAMNEMIVKILVELLSTLALATKEIKRGKLKKLVGKLVGEKKMEAMVQRLDRLTQDEARQTAAEVLKVVHGLVGNMKEVMDNGEVFVDHLKESLETMHEFVSGLNKAKRDRLQKDIFEWLSAPDPWKNHYTACESRHPGTAEWFIHGNTFPEWRASEVPSSLLWVHAKPGAGKSVFCSTIIEDIHAMCKAGLASLAFFYCDFRENRKTELRGLLSSFLVQLYHQSDSYFDILSKFYSEHHKGSRPPSDGALAACLMGLLKLPRLAPVYLIVDALDECPHPSDIRSPRAKVLSLINQLVKAKIRNLRVCVTSRPEHDIKDVLSPLVFRSVSLHDQSGQKTDIEDYIRSAINSHATNMWNDEDRKLAIDVLTEKSNGMYKWVDCQMVHICDCIPTDLREALAELPETLDETYERTLRGINNAKWKLAHRMFQFVSVASRPLRVKELADLIAFDFKAGSIPKYHEDRPLDNPAGAVLSICSTLFEFLTSTRLAEANDMNSRRYHVSMTPAHTLAAQSCLGILLHLDKDVTSSSIKDFPLAEYAAEHWVDHARFEDVSRNVEDGLKRLFDQTKPQLAICIWIYDPEAPTWQRMRLNETPPPLPQTSLHYAAFWGLNSVVEFITIEHQQDLHSQNSSKATPLHLALQNGHANTARKLIELGADAIAQNNNGQTPLHLALQTEQVVIARMLIERGAGATLAIQDNNGETPLHLTSPRGQVDVTQMLIERGADVTAKNNYGWTPLHLTLQIIQVDVARMLIERGADATSKNNNGETPLHLALQIRQVEVARMLIERGADVTAKKNDGKTPLHLASQMGRLNVARIPIEHGGDVTAHDKDRWTPFHLALQMGKVEVARKLIERCADLTAQNDDGETPLHLASQMGRVEVARMLIKHCGDVTAQDRDEWTPLHLALQMGQVDVARMLIEHGADLTAQNDDRKTPLHLTSRQVDVFRMLIERGADVSAQDKDGRTPLHLALQEGQGKVARMLIERGADLEAQDKDGRTLLHLALQEGQAEVARMLIERGADLRAQDKDGRTPLHLALQEGQVEVACMLIGHGAYVTAQDKDGRTPLHLALQEGQVEVVRMLIEHGADVMDRDKDGRTPLHLALQEGQVEVVRMLIEHGADVMGRDKDGRTPLHLALQEGQVEVACMLIEHGAYVTAQDKDGRTPLHLALRRGQVEVARMLIERGADVTVQDKDGMTPLHLASQEGIERGAEPDVSAQEWDGWTLLP